MTGKRFFIALFCVSLLFLCRNNLLFSTQAPEKQETSEEIFLRSPGYQALQGKNYKEALLEIEKLIETRKNDPYLLKMKGTLLLRLNQKSEGRKFLKKVLELNPMDRQARLELAQAYVDDQKKEEARANLRFIIDNPDERGYYEDRAQRALAVIESRRVSKPTKEEKRWKVTGTYGLEYDDNVSLKSAVRGFKIVGDRNAIRFNIKNGFSYDYFRDQTKRLGVAYNFSQSFHTDSLDEFNFRNHSVQHYATYFTQVLDRPTTLGFKYTFAHGTLDSKTFSSSNTFLPWISSEVVDNVVLSLYDNISVVNFRDKGFSNGVSSRDGLYNTTGVMTTFLFSKRKRSLSCSYEFGFNQTEGDNFDARAHAARTTFRTPLIEKVKGEASFSFVDDNHYNFASLPHREDLHFDLGAQLIRPITKWLEIRAYYYFTKVKNTHAGVLGQYQYSRNIVGGEVSFAY